MGVYDGKMIRVTRHPPGHHERNMFIQKRPVIRPTFRPLLESREFAEFAERLRALA